ncbi:hypothetical protein D0Z00_000677 [Geotrichum galactomycetum]|uniref:Uncharacterized protein n=1 Tax=Geotrichum galactomycetum TaxID=27317 RepID=A0ACB6V988_9ASCO|nr:hypothetical protein D0Z00_000677 [Geotrichum candidum]
MPNLPSDFPDLLLLNGTIVQYETLVGELIDKLASSPNLKRQVIDRLLEGKVKLDSSAYASIYIAPTKAGVPQSLGKPLLEVLFDALIPGGVLRGDFVVASSLDSIMTGFVESGDKTLLKPNNSAPQTISLLNKRKPAAATGTKKMLPIFKKLNNNNKRDAADISGIVQLNLNDNDDDDDNDLIDENDLISQSLSASIIIPAKCDPGPGKKRRKACKDCTCGLRELELQEEESRKQKEQGTVVSLNLDDEIDFTVPGKTGGSCGSCALGDAFRCDGCPYLGLPPFKPGEIINIAAIKNDF